MGAQLNSVVNFQTRTPEMRGSVYLGGASQALQSKTEEQMSCSNQHLTKEKKKHQLGSQIWVQVQVQTLTYIILDKLFIS